MIRDYGFIEPQITEEDYTFGGGQIKSIPLTFSGQWDEYLPTHEKQVKSIDTQGCVTFGTLNALEILFKKRGEERNFSDRFIANLSGTTLRGNTPSKVLDTIRKKGLVSEEILPFEYGMTWHEFYADIDRKTLREGKKFLKRYEVQHDWVFTRGADHKALQDALSYSPVGVSVHASRS